MPQVTIVGLFDNRAEAERAAGRLRQEAGLGPEEVSVHAGGAGADAEAARLPDLPPEDRAFYREGLRRGAVVISALSDDGLVPRLVLILGECGAADLEAREADWRAEGWAGPGTETGFTDHDEDIGYATYGGDAVIRRIPRRHEDDTPAGLLGRFEMAAMRDLPPETTRRARCYRVIAEIGEDRA
ncbi:hypothetical protein [Falsiroseomonas bella]|uniref:hypothetical protein n=1 Tax=Falsiroseomonas bella TaxID=2184016 RepID=UPI0011B7F6F2|nr:hypothetical protein [Falsiroseomonas bella]